MKNFTYFMVGIGISLLSSTLPLYGQLRIPDQVVGRISSYPTEFKLSRAVSLGVVWFNEGKFEGRDKTISLWPGLSTEVGLTNDEKSLGYGTVDLYGFSLGGSFSLFFGKPFPSISELGEAISRTCPTRVLRSILRYGGLHISLGYRFRKLSYSTNSHIFQSEKGSVLESFSGHAFQGVIGWSTALDAKGLASRVRIGCQYVFSWELLKFQRADTILPNFFPLNRLALFPSAYPKIVLNVRL